MNLPFVLDVAIGLIFTYLILSLLASELQELLATVLQWRAKHLKDSIEVLLAGGIGTPEEQRVKDLVNRLYNDPLLKNVNQEAKGTFARGFRRISRLLFPGNRQGAFGDRQATGPSYIAPETFATSLVERLGINALVDKLSEVRFERFVHRIIGSYSVNDGGDVELPSDDSFKDDWGKGKIRTIAAKANQTNLSEDPNFKLLVEEYHTILREFKARQANLETSVERMGEALDSYITARSSPDGQDQDATLFMRRLQSFKLNTFGEYNERAILSGGLKPTLSEIAELVNQGSATHQEVSQAYERLANQARPIDAQVHSAVQAQFEDYREGLDPDALEQLKTYDDLPYDLQQMFLTSALKDLTEDERQLYENYQGYKKIREGLSRLPASVKDSMAILARRAETRVQKAENDLSQFQDEIALWFDRSMTRASGVYKRNAKGVAILIGLFLAAATNSDTFHIFTRLSSDDSLRKLITDRAAALNLDATKSPRLAAQLQELKNETDAVLREIAFPITWNPTNLGRQLGCSPTLTPFSSVTAQPNPPNNPKVSVSASPTAPQPNPPTPPKPSPPVTAQPNQPSRGSVPSPTVTPQPNPTTNFNQPETNQPRQQWDNLYMSCLETQQTSSAPIPFQVAQIAVARPLGFMRMISGWMVSGIAIAMGAPFWFDLLGKLVNVRNSGSKPKPKAGEE